MATKKRAKANGRAEVRSFQSPYAIPGGLRGRITPTQARTWLEGLGNRLSLAAFLLPYAANEDRFREAVTGYLWAIENGLAASSYCIATGEPAALESDGTTPFEMAREIAALLRLCELARDEVASVSEPVHELHVLIADLLEEAGGERAPAHGGVA
jgi:hypothetical protein